MRPSCGQAAKGESSGGSLGRWDKLLALLPGPPAVLSSPGGPAKGHSSRTAAPGQLQSTVVPAWPRDPAGSSLVLQVWKTLQAGVGAQKAVLSLTPGGAEALEGRCLSW